MPQKPKGGTSKPKSHKKGSTYRNILLDFFTRVLHLKHTERNLAVKKETGKARTICRGVGEQTLIQIVLQQRMNNRTVEMPKTARKTK
jgi:hypothetical protein